MAVCSNVAPVSWFVIDHVNHGRSHLNFSEWSSYQPDRRRELLDGICKQARDGTMPLPSYTWIHWTARLSPADVDALCTLSASARISPEHPEHASLKVGPTLRAVYSPRATAARPVAHGRRCGPLVLAADGEGDHQGGSGSAVSVQPAVKAGGLIYVAGVISTDAQGKVVGDDVRAQVKGVLDRIRQCSTRPARVSPTSSPCRSTSIGPKTSPR